LMVMRRLSTRVVWETTSARQAGAVPSQVRMGTSPKPVTPRKPGASPRDGTDVTRPASAQASWAAGNPPGRAGGGRGGAVAQAKCRASLGW
jgi:hypothetical protein